MKKNSEFLQKKELIKLGFYPVGNNVRISRKISVYGAKGKIDDRVRIDDDVVIKGKFHLVKTCI